MRIAVLVPVLLSALLPAAVLAGERDTPRPATHLALPAMPKAECQDPRVEHTLLTAGQPVRVGTLKQEPRAGLYLAVQRLEDGCDKPVKIADDLGDTQR